MRTLQLGTRGSPLALRQAEWVRNALRALPSHPPVELAAIRTRAEDFPETPIARIGLGAFSRELDEALLGGRIDLAVHSLKDLPSEFGPELTIVAVPPRESPLDTFVSAGGVAFDALPRNARVGTGSPRRKAQLLARRPDIEVVPIRGNVETRISKVGTAGLAGTVLAHAGLKRLGREDAIAHVFSPDVLVPAVGQGALAIVARCGDAHVREIAQALDDPASRACVEAERAFLRCLRGGCLAPAGALAELDGPTLRLRAVLASEDGAVCLRAERAGPASKAVRLGEEAAGDLLARGGAEILEGLRKEGV